MRQFEVRKTYKGFLLKTAFLVILLVAVLLIIIAVKQISFSQSTRETVQRQTFFRQFVVAGGPIVWFVLLPMSVLMVFLAAEHSFTIRRKELLPDGISQEIIGIIKSFGLKQLHTRLVGRSDLVSVAVAQAISKARGDWFRMRSELTESLQDQALRLLRRIEWLNLIGNVSPMVGLFGTVFGMIKLFNAIVVSGGQPQPAQLAEGISVALVTTFWGLFIAIPALGVHGIFRNRIESILSQAVGEADDIVPQMRSILKKQQQAEATKQNVPIREISTKPSRAIRKESSELL